LIRERQRKKRGLKRRYFGMLSYMLQGVRLWPPGGLSPLAFFHLLPALSCERYALMSAILKLIAGHKVENFEAGRIVIEQGTASGPLLVLIQGEVEVLRDNVRVAKASEPGAVFGEMSVLLGSPHTATIRALKPSSFAIIENPRQFLEASAEASLHVARLLAARLDALTRYLADVKQQYEGHDHLGMVDDVLDTLMHHQPRRPSR
jgi:CRP/FNR family cyclic AMP-dependent transcriptional regulator